MLTRSGSTSPWRTGALLAAALLAGSTGALAAPRVIEETAKIPSPDPTFYWPLSVAVDGDWLIATGFKDLYETHPGGYVDDSAWLYQRQSNGSWTLVRRLVQAITRSDGDEPFMKVDIQGGVAAILKENASWIYQRSGTNWVAAVSPISTDGMDVEVGDGTIVVSAGTCDWIANAYRKGTNGAWTLVRQTEPQSDPDCENEDERGDVDVSGNAVMVFAWGNENGPYAARIFEGPFGGTAVMTRLMAPAGEPYVFIDPVAIDLPSALVDASALIGVQAFTRNTSGVWERSGALLRPDILAVNSPTKMKARGGLAVLGFPIDGAHGVRTGSASVFQRNTNGTYRYAAKLVASDRGPEQFFGSSVKVSGRRVVASNGGTRSVYVYDLPTDLTQPATMQDTFEDGNASDWAPLAGSAFAVATTNSRVYRQTSTVGNAASIWNNTDRTNQAIQADIKPTAYSTTTGDKWFGLVARYTNASNYYYVTLRNNNTVLLRKMVNGVFTTLDSAPLPIALNRNYRVRLEAIGTRLRLFVDDQVLAEASDSTHTHGQAGVMTYKTRADYDNIVVSGNPNTTLATYKFDFENDSIENWQTLGTWTKVDEVYAQSDLAAGARSITGVATDDQIVNARMRRTSAAGTNNWFGLAARYRDAGNYYYITLRNDNTIALRKLVNNAIVELDAAPLTVTTNTWYRARLEAIGTQLRVYINDQLLLEATDASHTTGSYGPVMYRTAAQYDDILAVQP